MADKKEKKEKGERKPKKLKSNDETKTSPSNNKANGKPRRRKAANRTAVVKNTEEEVGKKPERVKRTNRRTVRGRKAALNKSEDSANISKSPLGKSPRRISSRRVVSESRNINKSTKAQRSTVSTRRINKTDTKVNKRNAKKTTKGNKTKVVEKNLCSVCNDEESTMGGMCRHNFCFRCFKSLISKRLESSGPNDNHVKVPTTGKCSKCSCEVKKFQMRVCKDGKITERLAFADHKQAVKHSPIAGKVFAPSKGNEPHFRFDEDQPYIDVTDCVDADMDNWVLNDGYPVSDRLEFEKGYFFDEDTRTFHGKVKWPVTFRGAYQWDVVLSFKKKYNDMDVGIIHERKERVLDKDVSKGKSEEELVRLQYPFDGAWELTWRNADNEEKIAKVTVRNNQFQRGQYLFNLDMSDPSKVLFRWPGALYTANVASGANLMENPKGPEIGEFVSWKTMHPDFPEGFTWERLTIGEMPIPETLHFGIGNNKYAARSGEELASRRNNTTFEDSENFSETNSVESHSDNGSEPDGGDTNLRNIMRGSTVYFDYDFGILSLNKYDTSSGQGVTSAVQDPLLRDLFAS